MPLRQLRATVRAQMTDHRTSDATRWFAVWPALLMHPGSAVWCLRWYGPMTSPWVTFGPASARSHARSEVAAQETDSASVRSRTGLGLGSVELDQPPQPQAREPVGGRHAGARKTGVAGVADGVEVAGLLQAGGRALRVLQPQAEAVAAETDADPGRDTGMTVTVPQQHGSDVCDCANSRRRNLVQGADEGELGTRSLPGGSSRMPPKGPPRRLDQPHVLIVGPPVSAGERNSARFGRTFDPTELGLPRLASVA